MLFQQGKSSARASETPSLARGQTAKAMANPDSLSFECGVDIDCPDAPYEFVPDDPESDGQFVACLGDDDCGAAMFGISIGGCCWKSKLGFALASVGMYWASKATVNSCVAAVMSAGATMPACVASLTGYAVATAGLMLAVNTLAYCMLDNDCDPPNDLLALKQTPMDWLITTRRDNWHYFTEAAG
jgi:hypothetical protein